MNFINCQAIKRTSNKSKLSNRKMPAKYNAVLKLLFKVHAAMCFIDCSQKVLSKMQTVQS